MAVIVKTGMWNWSDLDSNLALLLTGFKNLSKLLYVFSRAAVQTGWLKQHHIPNTFLKARGPRSRIGFLRVLKENLYCLLAILVFLACRSTIPISAFILHMAFALGA